MTIVLAAAGLLVIAALVITLWVIGRQLVRRTLDRKLLGQAAELGALLGRLRSGGFEGIDKVLFDMRDTLDHRVVEAELHKELEAAGGAAPRDLARSFHMLGLTDRYLEEVRGAMTWRGRARAATALGLLGEPRALRPLVEAMRDEREDDDVKLACAEALAQLRDPAVIAEMCELLGDVDEWASPRLAQVLIGFGADAVEPLLATLDGAPGLNARVWAAQILGRLADRRATWPLIERLHDRSEQLRLSAANALAGLADARAVPPLIGVILRDPVAAVRAQAARALGAIGDESALPLLVASLGDPEYWMRFRALEAIEALQPADTTPIESALGDSNPEVRRRAVLALERLGKLEKPFDELGSDDEMVADEAERRLIAVGRAGLSERLLRHLQAPEAVMRARVARVLGQVGDTKHAGDLVAALADPEPTVVLEAIRALGELAVPSTAGALLRLVRNPDAIMRDAATDGLCKFDSAVLGAQLDTIRALTIESSDDVRVAALRVVTAVHDAAATRLLMDALTDRHAEARLEAVTGLGARGAQLPDDVALNVADALAQCLNDASEAVRVAAAEALGNVGGDHAVDHLLAALPQADAGQRDAICKRLAELGLDALQPALDVLLAHDDPKTRIGVTWTLGKTGDPRAVPLLAVMLEEPDAPVRASAAGALGKIPCPESAAALARALADPNPFVRAAAVNGLGRSGLPAMVVEVRHALDDPNDFVRRRAALAVGLLGGEAGASALLALADGAIDAAAVVVALGLTGRPAAIGEAMRRLRQPGLRAEVDALLEHEDAVVRASFHERIRPRTTTMMAVASADLLGADRLVAEHADALRTAADVAERRHAAEALASVDDDDARAGLAQALRFDPDVTVRRAAIAAIGDDTAALPVREAVVTALRDPDTSVRADAMRAAGAFLTPTDAGPLFDGLRASNLAVRDAAEEALSRVFVGDVDALHDWLMGQQAEVVDVGDPRARPHRRRPLAGALARAAALVVAALARGGGRGAGPAGHPRRAARRARRRRRPGRGGARRRGARARRRHPRRRDRSARRLGARSVDRGAYGAGRDPGRAGVDPRHRDPRRSVRRRRAAGRVARGAVAADLARRRGRDPLPGPPRRAGARRPRAAPPGRGARGRRAGAPADRRPRRPGPRRGGRRAGRDRSRRPRRHARRRPAGSRRRRPGRGDRGAGRGRRRQDRRSPARRARRSGRRRPHGGAARPHAGRGVSRRRALLGAVLAGLGSVAALPAGARAAAADDDDDAHDAADDEPDAGAPEAPAARRRTAAELAAEIAQLEAALAARPDDADLRLKLATRLYWAGRTDDARREALEVLARAPGYLDADVLVARIDAQRGDHAGARARVARVLATKPGFVDALLLEVDLALWSHRTGEARRLIAQLIVAGVTGIELTYRRAQLAMLDGKVDRAHELTDEILAVDPTHEGSQELRGSIQRMSIEAATDAELLPPTYRDRLALGETVTVTLFPRAVWSVSGAYEVRRRFSTDNHRLALRADYRVTPTWTVTGLLRGGIVEVVPRVTALAEASWTSEETRWIASGRVTYDRLPWAGDLYRLQLGGGARLPWNLLAEAEAQAGVVTSCGQRDPVWGLRGRLWWTPPAWELSASYGWGVEVDRALISAIDPCTVPGAGIVDVGLHAGGATVGRQLSPRLMVRVGYGLELRPRDTLVHAASVAVRTWL